MDQTWGAIILTAGDLYPLHQRKTMLKKLILVSVISLSLISCSLFNRIIGNSNPDPAAENIENVSSEDKEINAAIAQAQDTLPLFIEELQNPKPSQTHFSIKVRFPIDEDGNAEHMWVSDLKYTDGQFSGILGDEPMYIKNLHLGDQVTVDTMDISDWMIVDNHQMLGGFTTHVFLNRMTNEEVAQFEAESGFTTGDKPMLP
jgi:uncharacterized protein YegJ (DUF2314 family)